MSTSPPQLTPRHADPEPAPAAWDAADAPLRDDWQPPGSGATRRLAGFLTVLDIDAHDAPRWSESLERLRRHELQAVVVHGVLTSADCQRVLDALPQFEPALPRSSFPAPFRSSFFGHNLNLAHPALAGYFDDAARFNAALEMLPPQPAGLRARIAGLLSALDGGASFEAPPGPLEGQHYMFTTLREHLPGGFIPPHFDNEMRLRPSYRHLATLIDGSLLSFVLALTRAEDGGALEVFDRVCAPDAAMLLSDDRRPGPPDTAGAASVRFRLPAGSLIVLDSGRLLHQLTPVQGALARWTVCSFMARARAGHRTYCWG
jgi:hypothetical protein